MLYREMPKSGDKLSILGFGCMRLPGWHHSPDEEQSIRQIRYAIDKGVNYVDTAWNYHDGKSEVILGKALKDGYREKVKLADKLPQWMCDSREDMDYYLDEQLTRLDVEKIDYYLLHSIDVGHWRRLKELGVTGFLEQAKADGKIVNIGFSFHGPKDSFMEIIDDYDWDLCQIQYNILDEHNQAGIEGLNHARSKDIGVIVMEPLRGGALAGKQPAEVETIYRAGAPDRSNVDWALRWVWNHPGVITILSGMNDVAQIDENVTIAETADVGSMSEEELTTVQNAAETFRRVMKVPCTGCHYCMPCPSNVDIPACFSSYNAKYLFKQGFTSRMMYLLLQSGGAGKAPTLASQCVECGKCVEHCPQKIDIPAELKKVDKEFEGWLAKPLLFLLGMSMSKGRRRK